MTATHAIADHAENICSLASKTAMHYFRGTLGVEFKADESPVTQADKAVETEIRRYIKQHFPDHGILGEEHGQEDGKDERLWVIDPIDGTRSFLSGHPLFGFLLAHMVDGTPEFGAICMPVLNETFFRSQRDWRHVERPADTNVPKAGFGKCHPLHQ